MNGVEFVERLDKIRKEKGISRLDIAEHCGIKTNTISAWSSRGTIPAADIALKIAKYLGVSLEYLITGETAAATAAPDFPLEAWQKQPPCHQQALKALLEAYASQNA